MYTIGQRARLAGHAEAMYVADKLLSSNALVVVPGKHHPALFRDAAWVRRRHRCRH